MCYSQLVDARAGVQGVAHSPQIGPAYPHHALEALVVVVSLWEAHTEAVVLGDEWPSAVAGHVGAHDAD
jgi:hypothetical protein